MQEEDFVKQILSHLLEADLDILGYFILPQALSEVK